VRVTHLFSGVTVSDFDLACDWYERLFDSPPDSLPTEGEAIWHLASSASVYIAADPERAGNGVLTLAVKSLEDLRAGFARRGLVAEEGAELNGLRTLLVTDADGNMVKFFEDPSAAAS
jgi:hypothetical protein